MVFDRTDRGFKMTGRKKFFSSRTGFFIINSPKILYTQGSICNWQFIFVFIKLNTVGQFYSMDINIILEQIPGGMWIISKEDSFGDMALQLGFSLSRGLHIDTTYKGLKGEYVLLLECIFIN